jgi:Mrp family chromosome partitioning ATPase
MMQTMASLRENADYVIFDTPPLASASDALILASKVDGTLAVVQAGRARAQDVASTVKRLREARAKVLGIVLNKAKSPGRQYDYGEHATLSVVLPEPVSSIRRAEGPRIAPAPEDEATTPPEPKRRNPTGSSSRGRFS